MTDATTASQDTSQTDAATQQEPDIDALFAEAAAARDPQPEGATTTEAASGDTPAVDLPENTVEEGASPSLASDATPAKGDGLTKEEGDASTTQVEQPKTTEQPADANAWRASLPPEAAKYLRDLEHKARSDAGRVSGLTKKLESLTAAQRAAKQAEEEARRQQIAAFEEKYPEIAGAVKALVEPLQEEAEGAKQLASELAAKDEAAEQADRYKAVEDAHKGWLVTIKQPAFKEWLDSQTPGVKSLAESDEPGDAIALLDLFREKHPATSGNAQEAAPAATTTPIPASKTAAQVKAERAKKLADAVGVPSSKVVSRESTTESAGGELEQAFAYAAAKKAEQAAKAQTRRR